MCTYKTHIRVCRRCSSEDTVLISEQLCSMAKNSGSGIFGSCLSGVSSQRDQTGYKCWQCQEETTTPPASRSRSGSSGSGSSTAGGGGRRRGSSVSVPIGVQPPAVPVVNNSVYGGGYNYHYGRGQHQHQQEQQRRVSVSGQGQGQARELSGSEQDLERRLRRMGKMKADLRNWV
ncbi:hypothetical protein QBC45DRAFT_321353 [Copromyces sp. CBS 386.78]|nr:hypothetical protein QBC45DRAFT_321353 [Copromyces sp. CBS 386.78]